MAAQAPAIHDPTVRYPSDPMVRAAQAALAGAQANLRDARVDGTVESVALFGASVQGDIVYRALRRRVRPRPRVAVMRDRAGGCMPARAPPSTGMRVADISIAVNMSASCIADWEGLSRRMPRPARACISCWCTPRPAVGGIGANRGRGPRSAAPAQAGVDRSCTTQTFAS